MAEVFKWGGGEMENNNTTKTTKKQASFCTLIKMADEQNHMNLEWLAAAQEYFAGLLEAPPPSTHLTLVSWLDFLSWKTQ